MANTAYLIVGGAGFLGSHIVKTLLEKTDGEIIATCHNTAPTIDDPRVKWMRLDISDEESVRGFAKSLPSGLACVYAAGYIKPDDVDRNPLEAWRTNVFGFAYFIERARPKLESLVFTSTDMAAGESVGGHAIAEDEPCVPVNLYGRMKRACEEIVITAGFNAVRLPLMFGRSLNPARPHFIEHIEATIAEKKPFDILADYRESCLDYATAADIIVDIMTKFPDGAPDKLLNIGADTPLSKYDIAKRYAAARGLDASFLRPMKLAEASFFTAKRCEIILDSTRLKKLLGLEKLEARI
jgi:UDP-glucose 4-epimerase